MTNSSSEKLLDLLEQWQDARARGEHLSPTQLAPHDPALRARLALEIANLLRFDRFGQQWHPAQADLSPDPTKYTQVASQTPPDGRVIDLSPILDPSPDPRYMGCIGKYSVESILGQGGMGTVLRAYDPHLERNVAIKIVRDRNGLVEPMMRKRFLREARALAKIRHDHVVVVYDAHEHRDYPYLVMELLPGNPLDKEPGIRNSDAETIRVLGLEVASGLRAIHQQGLIHRDLKPSNLWMEHLPQRGRRVRILDFGLARETENLEGITSENSGPPGTPQYMSPEQIRGNPTLDGRSDLYSLGCVLYWMASGKPPVRGEILADVLVSVLHETPTHLDVIRPDLPRGLSQIIMSLLAKNPDERPANARTLEKLLREVAVDPPQPLEPPTPAFPAPEPFAELVPDRQRSWFGKIVLLLLILGCIGAAIAIQRDKHSTGKGTDTSTSTAGPQKSGDRLYAMITTPKRNRAIGEISDPNVLPAFSGDLVAINIELTEPKYAYVFWMDSDGKVEPIYPWRIGAWGSRPDRAKEEKLSTLRLPPKHEYQLVGDRDGMETFILLTRDEPLDFDDVGIQDWFKDNSKWRTIPKPDARIWFENGKRITSDPRRAGNFEPGKTDSPLLDLQNLLQYRLGGAGVTYSTVSFARLAKKNY